MKIRRKKSRRDSDCVHITIQMKKYLLLKERKKDELSIVYWIKTKNIEFQRSVVQMKHNNNNNKIKFKVNGNRRFWIIIIKRGEKLCVCVF